MNQGQKIDPREPEETMRNDDTRRIRVIRPKAANAAGRELVRSETGRRGVVRRPGSSPKTIVQMQDPRLFSKAQLEYLKIIHPQSDNRKLVDTFRELRTRLMGLRDNQNFTVMVTSVAPGGGGSFVAMNLAASIAFEDSKTSLLLDCNLRDPYVHKILQLAKLDNGKGLTDFLANPTIGIESVVRPSGIPRMRMIPVGGKRESATEYFSSRTMHGFFNEVSRRYRDRYVIVDAPSIASSADAKILANLVDYIILVVPYGKISANQIASICHDVDQSKLIGTVLNDEPLAEF